MALFGAASCCFGDKLNKTSVLGLGDSWLQMGFQAAGVKGYLRLSPGVRHACGAGSWHQGGSSSISSSEQRRISYQQLVALLKQKYFNHQEKRVCPNINYAFVISERSWNPCFDFTSSFQNMSRRNIFYLSAQSCSYLLGHAPNANL